ncbi:MAG: hypothetical protein GF404_12285 [candidate division Zixibacteria bacterium]|nr:hypothetical protein [candidate division Zixibacteria bacterium]
MVEIITRNLTLKIVALVLAGLFWFHVVTEKEYNHEFEVPFVFQGISDGLILTTPPPERIHVRLSGTGKELLGYIFKKPALIYQTAIDERGIYPVELTSEDLYFDDNIQAEVVDVIEPRELKFRIENVREKVVDVIPKVDITPALGYVKLGELEVQPDTVKVSGPQRVVRYLRSVSTRELKFDDVKKNIDENIRLEVADTLFITPESTTVNIFQRIVPIVEKRFGPLAIETYNTKLFDSTLIYPDSIYLQIEGPRGLIDSLEINNFSAIINFRGLEAGSTLVMPDVVVPDGYKLIETDPNSVIVKAYKSENTGN